MSPTIDSLVQYFRCPESLATLDVCPTGDAEPGFFRFGDAICYGRQTVGAPALHADGFLIDVERAVSSANGRVVLPFDLSEVVGNLLFERYPRASAGTAFERVSTTAAAHALYYFLRPILPVGVRKHLQKARLRGWQRLAFPRFPVDATVDTLMRNTMRLLLSHSRLQAVPFISFWPEGATGCVMMTHDVEGSAGAAFAPQLMDLDDRFGIRSAFHLVPEAPHTRALLDRCRQRGFEVNVHDLNHDGHLFSDKALFDARVSEINRYARDFGCSGFRSGAMYRRQEWFSSLDISFDMSVPAVAHFEPQQGGCCTVMPHFIGDVLELPLTTTQDYALFHYLGDYSVDLWKAQTELILAHQGLVSFITHPDYLTEARAHAVYVKLLEHVSRLRDERNVWVARPSEIDRWWRNRRAMRLVADGDSWRIEGPDSDRARVAYLRLHGEHAVSALAAA